MFLMLDTPAIRQGKGSCQFRAGSCVFPSHATAHALTAGRFKCRTSSREAQGSLQAPVGKRFRCCEHWKLY